MDKGTGVNSGLANATFKLLSIFNRIAQIFILRIKGIFKVLYSLHTEFYGRRHFYLDQRRRISFVVSIYFKRPRDKFAQTIGL